jgi:ATP-binding cassette subfamily D (ALD) long-chain fatty acid import protein
MLTALITISTRASLKRHHNLALTLGVAPTSTSPGAGTDGSGAGAGDAYTYTLQRIGTAQEKQTVERELAELRQRLGLVDGWKTRRNEIEKELGWGVGVAGGDGVGEGDEIAWGSVGTVDGVF